MGESGAPTCGPRILHHWTEELLIQQNTVPYGETASPVQEKFQRSKSLRRFLSHLNDMVRLGEPFIKGHPKITAFIDLLD